MLKLLIEGERLLTLIAAHDVDALAVDAVNWQADVEAWLAKPQEAQSVALMQTLAEKITQALAVLGDQIGHELAHLVRQKSGALAYQANSADEG